MWMALQLGMVQRIVESLYQLNLQMVSQLMYLTSSQLLQGWVKGQKLKYQGTRSYEHFIRSSSLSVSSQITQYNRQSRIIEDYERKMRSQSLFDNEFVGSESKTRIEKIAALKESFMKQREGGVFAFKLRGLELPQMTRIFSPEVVLADSTGLVVRTGVFQHCVNDSQVQYVQIDDNIVGSKTAKLIKDTSTEHNILEKRNQILNFKRLLEQPTPGILNLDRFQKQHSLSPAQKRRKTLNIASQLLKSNIKSSSKLNRSKSALRRNQIKQFEDKISLLVRKQLSKTFLNNMNKGFDKKNDKYIKPKLIL